MDATHCIDIYLVNFRSCVVFWTDVLTLLVQLGYREARVLARFGVTFVILSPLMRRCWRLSTRKINGYFFSIGGRDERLVLWSVSGRGIRVAL
jgi:hypothetical protein